SAIMEAVDMRPEMVTRQYNEESEIIPAEDAEVGDILLVRPGDRIPLDGRVIEGNSLIDTSPVTGEPVPVSVKEGSEIISGCVNTSGLIKMRVEKPLDESMVTRILESVENAAASKPQMERFITRFARVYTPIVVAIALITAIVPSLLTGNWNYWIYTALTFLVISCPCAMVLSVPLAFFAGIGAGSRKGILFKGGTALEALRKVKAVVMDKTGTITKGNFVVQAIDLQPGFDLQQVLSAAAACESHSTHPIALSIVEAARERLQQLPAKPDTVTELAGRGVTAQVGSSEVLCGNHILMAEYAIEVGKKEGYGTHVYVAIDGALAGVIHIADTIKEDAVEAVRKMKRNGVQTVMLTGDARESAESVARTVGVEVVKAELLPQDKLTAMQQVRSEAGVVMFVGDGINDAPVLAGADVGAAMGSGADAAIEAADVVFMTSKMEAIPQAMEIARKSMSAAVQNVVFALVIKVIVMILGLLGIANMWLAVFADSGVALLCVLNSIRILRK
ncbi:MAG: cadmium-translocating P-type ATPase, partial [Firmicutes bacterium]|nr:cadmium-translocating P-type ATPase [Bacillota bacterium]